MTECVHVPNQDREFFKKKTVLKYVVVVCMYLDKHRAHVSRSLNVCACVCVLDGKVHFSSLLNSRSF